MFRRNQVLNRCNNDVGSDRRRSVGVYRRMHNLGVRIDRGRGNGAGGMKMKMISDPALSVRLMPPEEAGPRRRVLPSSRPMPDVDPRFKLCRTHRYKTSWGLLNIYHV